MSYVVWLSHDGENWTPKPTQNPLNIHSMSTQYPHIFEWVEEAENAANEVLCEGQYKFARVYDKAENVVSEFEVTE